MSLSSVTHHPDHIYLDVNLYNDSFAGPTGMGKPQYIAAEVNQVRDSPIIYEPYRYNLTIARFSISASDVERVSQPPLITDSTTLWFVGLSYEGVYYTQPIVIPTTMGRAVPVPEKVIFNVNAYLDLINAGFLAAQTAAQTAGAPTGPTGSQVIMTFDPATSLYTLNVPETYGTGTIGMTAGNGVGVHMSFLLYQKFQSFNVIQNNPLLYGAGFNSDVTYVREWTGNNYTTDIYINGATSGVYMQLRQDAAWASSISNINRLQITVSQIPITQEYVQTISTTQDQGGPANQIAPILTDFFIGSNLELSSVGESYIYTPPIYRICSLQGTAPLKGFSIKIYIVTTSGVRFPLYLAPGSSMSLKLLFLEKGLTS
jgi:hypothetical protein